jgi:hypothetical protein
MKTPIPIAPVEIANPPRCPTCAMNKNDWPGEGYSHEGQTYCCQGCAEGTGCTCRRVPGRGFSGEGDELTRAKPRAGEQAGGASAPAGELSGERDAKGTEEGIDQCGVSGAVTTAGPER